jgi:hypothetical protein
LGDGRKTARPHIKPSSHRSSSMRHHRINSSMSR